MAVFFKAWDKQFYLLCCCRIPSVQIDVCRLTAGLFRLNNDKHNDSDSDNVTDNETDNDNDNGDDSDNGNGNDNDNDTDTDNHNDNEYGFDQQS